MGKREKKTGKGRLDKYYKLAKEQGYRARSAFKLIQLDKKFSFLHSCRCLIDLCAAPGGWLQVATKYMPPSSLIVGVDLVPIRAIPKVITFADDITTDSCRVRLRQELKDWKADVVLHDGAPNVGTAWVQDAFTQAELVLSSLKLATEFLAPGGTFVTKVFRSRDYNSLLWVFNQLFTKVEATKPPSSRNVSAEIFVVCLGFLAPKRIDPKLLSAKEVFKDVDSLVVGADGLVADKPVASKVDIFRPEVKRRRREGYDEGDLTLFKTGTVAEFIATGDPIGLLSSVNRLTFDQAEDEPFLTDPSTTAEIKADCADLKVLGKRDFKRLLKWRLGLREQAEKAAPVEEVVEVEEIPVDDEAQAEIDLERMKEAEASKLRRERRRINHKKARELLKMRLNMSTPMDLGEERHDDDVMDDIHRGQDLDQPDVVVSESDDSADEKNDPHAFEDEEQRAEALALSLDDMYADHRQRILARDPKERVKLARDKSAAPWYGISTKTGDESSEDEGGDDNDEMASNASDASDLSFESDDEEVRKSTTPAASSQAQTAGRKRKRDESAAVPAPPASVPLSRSAALWFSQPAFKGSDSIAKLLAGVEASAPGPTTSRDSPEIAAVDDVAPVKMSKDAAPATRAMFDDDDDDEAVNPDLALLTPEAMTLAIQLVNRERSKSDLIDQGFNRHAMRDTDGLPEWFLDDETKHFRHNIPITKEAVDILRQKSRALNTRPIKKVAEAKARKRMRAERRLAKTQKKATALAESGDLTEREKAASITKLLSSARKAPKQKQEIKLVVARGVNRGNKGRPVGVKGRYKMVDPRMKKEMRATKRIARRKK